MPRMKCLLLVSMLPVVCAMGGDCSGFDFNPGGQVCTTIAVPSVVLNIRDAQGRVVPSATASYRINNSQVFQGFCNGSCGNFTLAFELVGRFNISITALGLQRRDIVVDVAADEEGCHPVTEQVDVVMQVDNTVGALAGVWRVTSGFFGDTIIRFGDNGEIIGAILLDRTVAGDGNFYVQYNGRQIRGAPGQPLQSMTAPEPTRIGNLFTWETTTFGIPTGFTNAAMTADFVNLTGTLGGQPASYRRLSQNEIPAAIMDP